jgi:HEAT repeat protein
MNQILKWLAGGDLRSDGMSNEAAEFVLEHPELCSELVEGLDEADDVIRGRTADALEKVSRARPDLVIGHLARLIDVGQSDPVPMVKMHVAMTLGHLAMYENHVAEIKTALLNLLGDKSVFAKSWAIVSLCIVAVKYPQEHDEIVERIAQLQGHSSTAIRSRVRKALHLLTSEEAAFPKGWIKSEHLGETL